MGWFGHQRDSHGPVTLLAPLDNEEAMSNLHSNQKWFIELASDCIKSLKITKTFTTHASQQTQISTNDLQQTDQEKLCAHV